MLDKAVYVRMEQQHWEILKKITKERLLNGHVCSVSDIFREAVIHYWKLPTNGETKE